MNTTLKRPAFVDKHYCPVRHLPRLNSASCFEEVGSILLEVLGEMHVLYPGHEFHQVCGPISTGGDVLLNLQRFDRAIAFQREKGRTVFNQLPAESALERLWNAWKAKQPAGSDEYCYELLYGVYLPIFKSGLIDVLCFMPNWKLSTGTRWERDQATLLQIRIEDFPHGWEEDILL